MMQGILVFLIFVLLFILTRPKPKPQNKHPTIEDIQRKYPRRKSKQQLEEARKERQDAYDRDFADRKRSREVAQPTASRQNTDSSKYKKLLAMLGGDRATTDRLISAYGVDKAILDLERDRQI